MAQVLLIDNNPELSKVIRLNLMKLNIFEVTEFEKVKDGIEQFKSMPTFDLIVIKENEIEKDDILELLKETEKSEKKIFVILIGNKTYNYKFEMLLPVTSNWEDIVEAISSQIVSIEKPDSKYIGDGYVAVPINYFFDLNDLSVGCDIFIRLKKEEKDFHYVKRLNSTDFFNAADIERYFNSGLKEFFVTKEAFPTFVNVLTDKLKKNLATTSKNKDDNLKYVAESLEITIKRTHALGIDDKTIELAMESVKKMGETLEQSSVLTNFLKNLKENQLSFAFSHSYFTCLLLHRMLKHFEWDSPAVREKLTYLSYFHDIAIEDIECQKIGSLKDLEAANLSKDQKILILNHAYNSSIILEKIPGIPAGVVGLVREHHGMKSGMGFRDGLATGVSPMAMKFILVEEFVHAFLKYPEIPTKKQIEDIFIDMEKEYSKPTYMQTLLALKSALLSNT